MVVRTVDNIKKQLLACVRRPNSRHAISLAMSMMFGVVLAFILPQRFTEDILTDKLARLAAPVMSAIYNTAYRNEITVVLIDQKSLGRQRWPVSYAYYSKLLRTIASRSPKAIFLDIVLVHENDETFESLRKTIADLSKGTQDRCPIKIFLAAIRYDTRLVISPQVDPLKEPTKVAVEYEASSVDRLAWSYSLIYRPHHPTTQQTPGTIEHTAAFVESTAKRSAADGESTRAEPEEAPSAAFAIYRALYPAQANNTAQGEEAPSAVALTWGLLPAEKGPKNWTYNPTEEEENEREENHGSFTMGLRRLAYWLWLAEPAGPRAWPRKLDGTDTSTYCSSMGVTNKALLLWRAEGRALFPSVGMPLCAYHRTVIAGELDDMEGSDRQDAFANKIVMIGTALDDGGDLVVSPLHDRLPGVYLHAMALDNLISSNGRYVEKREPALGWSNGKWRLEAVALCGMAGVLLLNLLKRWCKPGFRRVFEGRAPNLATRRRPLRAKPGTAVIVAKTAFRHARPHAMAQKRPYGVRAAPRRHGGKPPSLGRRIGFIVTWKLFTLCAGIVLTIALLLFGQQIFHESYLAVAHVVACAMTAEWLEWGNKFVDFFNGHVESES